ncbi:MAG TPA: BadF/BadG/BcrA/BcrD ATPase family protein [Anaerolineae bacterium]|nr:BadF/BadG/BcrA/BcrD ATPase family protein [Anaerolineae bacterium]
MNNLILGIDGGGTRTRAQLANGEGRVLGAGHGGTSNPMVHGLEAAERELDMAIARAFEQANLPRERVNALVMGLGGAGGTREQNELSEWARTRIAERVRVVNDAEIVLAAGAVENWGVALIAGTGSFAWGRNRAGETARAGGWGYLMGDEGSGFDLARQGLRAATQAADGRGESTRLLDAILEFWHLAAVDDLTTKVYRSGLSHAEIARVAQVVVRTAETGDAVAERLVGEAAYALALAVRAVSRALELNASAFPLALTGGLLLGSLFLREKLIGELEREGGRASPIELVHEPIVGAVRLARELAEHALTNEVET